VHVFVFGGILDFTLFYEENVIGGIGLGFFWGVELRGDGGGGTLCVSSGFYWVHLSWVL
jgi:hypothetical protein